MTSSQWGHVGEKKKTPRTTGPRASTTVRPSRQPPRARARRLERPRGPPLSPSPRPHPRRPASPEHPVLGCRRGRGEREDGQEHEETRTRGCIGANARGAGDGRLGADGLPLRAGRPARAAQRAVRPGARPAQGVTAVQGPDGGRTVSDASPDVPAEGWTRRGPPWGSPGRTAGRAPNPERGGRLSRPTGAAGADHGGSKAWTSSKPRASSRSIARARTRCAPWTALTHRPGGQRAGPARPERRRQDHHRAHHRHAAAPGRRPRHGGRLRHGQAGPGAAPHHRPLRPVRGRGREPHRPREPLALRSALPAALAGGARSRRRAARAVRPGRCRRPCHQDLLRRHAPAPRPRQRPHRPASPAHPRRAHHGPDAAASRCGASSATS